MNKLLALGAAFAVAGLAAAASFQSAVVAQPAPVQPSPAKRNILQRADVPGTNLETIYATVEIAPNFKAGRHSHPGVVMFEVLDGEFWIATDGQTDKVMKVGESMTIPSGAVHNEGAGAKGVKLTVVYVVEKGKPLVQPAP
jgi:quercetin dioxygenase-like cupin family protein